MSDSSSLSNQISFASNTALLTTSTNDTIYTHNQHRLIGFIHHTRRLLTSINTLITTTTNDNSNTFTFSYPLNIQQHASIRNRHHSSILEEIDADASFPNSSRTRSASCPLTQLTHKFKVLTFDSSPYINLPDSALSSLLLTKIQNIHTHLHTLESRVSDRTCRILITGDLNAGKSTFVNALLRRQIVPTDQQPLTNVFTEVLDAKYNHFVEEMHAIVDPTDLNGTKDVFPISALNTLVIDPEPYGLLKVYIREHHHPLTAVSSTNTLNSPSTQSNIDLLHTDEESQCADEDESSSVLVGSEDVDVRLIDSPGLNRDVWRTMALFSRQAEIDVIVFVVSAENHFTLSSREFLQNAGQEKAYIFIVINKFDAIRDKNRCIKAILDQIQILSPMTYELRNKLVHFVSAEAMLLESKNRRGRYASNESDIAHFLQVEQALKEFTLEKRAISKLHPAKQYMHHLLGDLVFLLAHNIEATQSQVESIQKELQTLSPQEVQLDQYRQSTGQKLDMLVHSASNTAASTIANQLASAKLTSRLTLVASQVPWPGLKSAIPYIYSVHNALLNALAHNVDLAQADAHLAIHQAYTKTQDMYQSWMNKHVSSTSVPLDEDAIHALPPLNLPNVLLSQMYPVTQISGSTFSLLFPMLQRPGSGIPSWVCALRSALMNPQVTILHCWSYLTHWTWMTPINILTRLCSTSTTSSLALTGCSLVTSSILATHSVPGSLMRLGVHVGLRRVAWITVLGVASIGSVSLAHWFTTLPSHLPNIMTRSIIEHMHAKQFTHTLAAQVSTCARVALSQSVAHAQSQMDMQVVRVRRYRTQLAEQVDLGTAMCEQMHETLLRTKLLQSQVNAVEIEDPFKGSVSALDASISS